MAFSGSFSGARTVAEKGKRWLKRALQIMLCSLFSLVLFGCVNRAQSIRVVDLPDVPNRGEVRQLTNSRRGGLSEVAPPAIFLDLDDLDAIAHPSQQPQVAIAFPKPDDVLEEPSLNVKFKLRGLSIYKDEKTGIGPHLQVTLDNQPAKSVYSLDEALEFSDLTPGSHTLRVLAVKPWGESFKNETAYAQTTFHIFAPTGENIPDPNLPTLTYNEPQGTYGAQPILLDFHLNNAPLHQIAASDPTLTDWRIRCDVNGKSFIFDQWQPIYLNGFKPGRNWVQLTLIDEEGNPIENAFNSTVRIINFDPAQRDTLARMTRGELPLSKVGQVVDPNYEPPVEVVPAQTPAETPAEKPADEIPSEVPTETQQPSEERVTTRAPEPKKPATNSTETSKTADEPVTIDQPTADKTTEKAKDTEPKTEAKTKESNRKKPTEDEVESSAKPAPEKETVKSKADTPKEPEEAKATKNKPPLAKEKPAQPPRSQPEAKPFSNEFRNFDDFDQDSDLDKGTTSEDKVPDSRKSESKNTSKTKNGRNEIEQEKPLTAPSQKNPIEPGKKAQDLNSKKFNSEKLNSEKLNSEKLNINTQKSLEEEPSGEDLSLPETNPENSPEPTPSAEQTDQGVSPSIQDRLQTFLNRFQQSDAEKTAPVIPAIPNQIDRSTPFEATDSRTATPQEADLSEDADPAPAITTPSNESDVMGAKATDTDATDADAINTQPESINPSADNRSLPATNPEGISEPTNQTIPTEPGTNPSIQDRLQTFLKRFQQSDTEKTAPVIPGDSNRIERSAALEEETTLEETGPSEPTPQDVDLPSELTAPSKESKAELIRPKSTLPEPAKFGAGNADVTGDSSTADTLDAAIDAEQTSEEVLEEALEQAIEQASPAAEEFIEDAEQLVDGAQDAVTNFFSNRINRFKSRTELTEPTEITPTPTESPTPIPTETTTEKATEEALP